VNGLLSATRNFDEDVYEVLDVFEDFMNDLSDTNQTFSSVMLQLHQFKSQMETCERSISHSKNQQRATEGTISVIESIFHGITDALTDAKEQLSDAESLSRGNFKIQRTESYQKLKVNTNDTKSSVHCSRNRWVLLTNTRLKAKRCNSQQRLRWKLLSALERRLKARWIF